MISYNDLIFKYKDYLRDVSFIPKREVEILVEFLTRKDRLFFIKNENFKIKENIRKKIRFYLEKRKRGFPLEYIIKKKEFFGIEFFVNKYVLIPRPETEMIVEEVLKFLKDKDGVSVLDLGTGSGCISISIATELLKQNKKFKITAVDISQEALNVAKKNAKNNEVLPFIEFKKGSWFENINQKFDVIISNPPYVNPADIKDFPNLKYEPKGALFSNQGGLEDINHLIKNAINYLNEGGLFLFEFGKDQKELILKNSDNKIYNNVMILNDLANIPRIFRAQN